MRQTGYLPIAPFSKRLSFNAGFCQWWYTPWQNIAVWPTIDPLTQYLSAEPTLVNGATWLGPIKVPNSLLGFQELPQSDKAGIYYKQSVSGIYPGDSGSSRVNLENMPYNQFAVVGKMRAGGLFLLLGNEEYGLTFSHKYDSDKGAAATSGSDFSFSYESLYKGAVLETFLGMNVTPPPDGSPGNGGGPGNGDGANKTRVIYFYNASIMYIPWDVAIQGDLGAFPLIEVWIDDTTTGGQRALANVPIYVDAFPPDTTLITVELTGVCSGIIILK